MSTGNLEKLDVEREDDDTSTHIHLTHTGNLSFLGTEPSDGVIECVVYQELIDEVGLGE